MTQSKFESEQAAWEYYLNLDSHNSEEKQHNNIYTDAFEAGAEFEHKRLVEKACEWLKENLFEGYDPDNYPMVRCYDIDMEDFIEEFRREMEE